MNHSFKNILLVGASSTLILSSCKIFNPYQRPEISPAAQNELVRDVPIDTASTALIKWKNFFTDAHLQNLITSGLANNNDLKNAIEQITQAQAGFQQSRLALLPSLNFAPTATYNKSSRNALNFPPNININLETTTYQLGFASNWEADIWGKLASARRSALANLLKTRETRKVIETQLVATIANSYYTLLALDQQRAITLETIENRKKGVETMKALKKSAIVNGAAVVQSESNLYAVEVSLPDIEQSIREVENALSVLIGKPSNKIERSRLSEQTLAGNFAQSIPIQLLENRPDVKAAELTFRSAFENTNNARTFFYPSLTITSATTGISALAQNSLWNKTAIFGNVLAGLTQPIFNKGANQARLKIAKSQQEQALNNFHQTLLIAGQEVTNAYTAIEASHLKIATRTKQITALEKAVDFTKELLQYSSSTNYTDVLTSEQSLLNAQLNQVNDHLQELQSSVRLYQALGGGTE